MLFDPNAFDPILLETVERSLEPYKSRLSAETIDKWREEALLLLTYHPYSAALLQQLRLDDQPELQHSTWKSKEGAAEDPSGVEGPISFPSSVKGGGGR
jgi:hypothetical protein